MWPDQHWCQPTVHKHVATSAAGHWTSRPGSSALYTRWTTCRGQGANPTTSGGKSFFPPSETDYIVTGRRMAKHKDQRILRKALGKKILSQGRQIAKEGGTNLWC